jgi:hypothetical protein
LTPQDWKLNGQLKGVGDILNDSSGREPRANAPIALVPINLLLENFCMIILLSILTVLFF